MLSEAQKRVLNAAVTCGAITRDPDSSLYRWYARYPNGMVAKVAGNDTVYVLQRRGLLSGDKHRAEITPAGRAALEDANG